MWMIRRPNVIVTYSARSGPVGGEISAFTAMRQFIGAVSRLRKRNGMTIIRQIKDRYCETVLAEFVASKTRLGWRIRSSPQADGCLKSLSLPAAER